MLSSRTSLVALLLATTACSAAPDQSSAAAPATGTTSPATPTPTPSPSASTAPVTSLPDDAPDATVPNVPATTGRGNLATTAPPFTQATIGSFNEPFAIAILPDGSALVTEKAGKIKLRKADGTIADIPGAPKVLNEGQGGWLDIALAPDFASSKLVYLSYSEPRSVGSSLALARGQFLGTGLIATGGA